MSLAKLLDLDSSGISDFYRSSRGVSLIIYYKKNNGRFNGYNVTGVKSYFPDYNDLLYGDCSDDLKLKFRFCLDRFVFKKDKSAYLRFYKNDFYLTYIHPYENGFRNDRFFKVGMFGYYTDGEISMLNDIYGETLVSSHLSDVLDFC